PLVDAPAIAIDQHVPLQAIGQTEDDPPAIVAEASGPFALGERMGEEVLLAGVAGEVITAPVDHSARLVPLDESVVARDARAVEAGPRHALLPDVPRHVHAQPLLQVALGLRELEHVVI